MLVEKFDVAVKAVIGLLVTPVDERISAINHLDTSLLLIQRGDIWIILPEFRTASANVGFELVWIASVEVADRGSHHDDIAGREKASQD
jgi:hypothetical protein